MTPFKIKVCGITRKRDAATAARLGADFVGMIFWPESPRGITEADAREIVTGLLPTVQRVGVFVDTPIDQLLAMSTRLLLDWVQLHGPYSEADEQRARRAGFRVIRVSHIASQEDYRRLVIDPADLILLDNRSAVLPGGTGERFDWGLQPDKHIPNLVLAGGITKENVAEGVKIFQPLVVDVNSGVESEPGVKSADKLTEFFSECDRIRYGS
jgi:phosphoribosylanthranilate isomerase